MKIGAERRPEHIRLSSLKREVRLKADTDPPLYRAADNQAALPSQMNHWLMSFFRRKTADARASREGKRGRPQVRRPACFNITV